MKTVDEQKELMMHKLREIEVCGDRLSRSGYRTKDTVLKSDDDPINLDLSRNPNLYKLFSIIPLIFKPGMRNNISSYDGKHVLENYMHDRYITNGEFILVMICLGYRYKTPRKDSQNLDFYGSWSETVTDNPMYKF